MKKAWQIERKLRDEAVPMDRRIHDSNWFDAEFVPPQGDDLIQLFWKSNVPGSGAPEIPYQEMIQAQANKGYDVSKAEELLPIGLKLLKEDKREELRVVTAQILAALYEAPIDPDSAYHTYSHPETWETVLQEMKQPISQDAKTWNDSFAAQIYQGWIGQLAGGAFGTAIEGYTGEQIEKVYGKVNYYITQPETMNDDVVYELIFLDVYEEKGKQTSSVDLGLEWIKQITFGWSAEWIALRNLNQGLMPPLSGSWNNPYSDWIGTQMREMICGLVAPAKPLEAARLAFVDGVVSHSKNGVYGGMYAAAMTAIAFSETDPRNIVLQGLNYIPQNSEYMAISKAVLEVCQNETDPQKAWKKIEPIFEKYNWIHAYPNIGGVIYSLWYGAGSFEESMSLLARAGNDVDCSAGLVGTILGIINPIPEKWSEPIGDLLETYIKGKEQLSIRELADKTAKVAKKTY